MKQVTYTLGKVADLNDIIHNIKQEALYETASDILIQAYTSIMNQNYVKSIIDILNHDLTRVKIAGVSTCAEIAGGETYTGTIVLSVLFFEKSEVIIEEYDCDKRRVEDIVIDVQQKTKSQFERIKGVQIFGTSMKFAVDLFIDLMDMHDKNFCIFGAGAGTPDFSQDNMFIFGNKIYDNGIIAVIYLGEELQIDVHYDLGWQPVGKEMKITETDGRLCMKTIDGEPAAAIYKKYLNADMNDKFIRNVMEFPLILKREGVTITRTPVRYGEDGSLYMAADIHKGEKVRFGYGNYQNLLGGVLHTSHELYNKGIQAILLIVCLNRQIFLNKMAAQEIQYFQDVGGAMAGCYAFAEIMKCNEGGGIMNSALVSVGMYEKGTSSPRMFQEKCIVEDESVKNKDNSIPLNLRLVTFMGAITADLEEYALRLKKLARIDELTQIWNRRRIEEILEYEIVKRSSVGKLSLIMFDIDKFKNINDTYGHEVGDEVLSGLIKCIEQGVRVHDSLGRWGGEEFLCILPDTEPKEALLIAERIRLTASRCEFESCGQVTISLGVTTAIQGDTADTIFKRVDHALYNAKNSGRNQVRQE